MSMNLVARLSLDDQLSGRMGKVTRSLDSVEKRTRSATKGFSGMSASIGKLGAAVGVTALLAKGMGMVKNSIGSAFDRIDTMERYERTMTTMLGSTDAAKQSLEALNEAVTGTAYGLDNAARNVQSFVSRGIEVNKATKWFESMGDAVAFYGDGSNEQLESVSEAMAKMVTSGKVSMQHMQTLSLAGIDATGMYAKAVGMSSTEVQKALSSGTIGAEEFFDVVTTAMNEGTNGVQKIAGTAKEAGATWAGAIANMQFAVVRGVQTIIMTIDEMLTENGLPTMRDMVSSFGKAFESALKSAAKVISPVIGGLVRFYKAIKPIMPIVKSFGKAIAIAVGSIMLATAAIKVIVAAVGLFSVPVWLAIGAITALVLGFKSAYKSSEPFRQAIEGAIGAVKGLYSAFKGDDTEVTMDIFRKAGLDTAQINKVIAFGKSLKGAFDRVKEVFDGVATMATGGGSADLFKALGFSPELVGNITRLVETVKTKAGEMVTFLSEKWTELQPGLQILFDAFSKAGEFIAEVFTTLLSVLSPIFDALTNAFMIVADIAVMVFDTIIAPAIGFVMDMFKLLWKIVGPILVLLGTAIQVAFDILKVVWDTIIKPVAKYLMGTFKDAFEKAQPHIETLGTAFDKIGGLIEWATDKLKVFSGWLKDIKIPDWVSTIGGKVSGAMSYVSGFLSGGAPASNYHGKDRVPYDGYLTRLHRGERVLTRQEADAMDHISFEGASGGATYNNQTYNNVTTTHASPDKKASNSGITVHMHGTTIREDADVDRMAAELYRKISAAGMAGA